MRAIDADALIDDLKHDVAIDQDSLDYEELTDSNREKIQFDKDCKQNAIDLLQNAPTIEPQPDIIHCGECRYYIHKDNIERVEFGKCSVIKSVCLCEDYCSWAERKEGEADG